MFAERLRRQDIAELMQEQPLTYSIVLSLRVQWGLHFRRLLRGLTYSLDQRGIMMP